MIEVWKKNTQKERRKKDPRFKAEAWESKKRVRNEESYFKKSGSKNAGLGYL